MNEVILNEDLRRFFYCFLTLSPSRLTKGKCQSGLKFLRRLLGVKLSLGLFIHGHLAYANHILVNNENRL